MASNAVSFKLDSLCFQLLDFVSMNTARYKYHVAKQEGGWHRIGWAFLKVLGGNGLPNTDKKVRLQLYYPPIRFRSKGDELEVGAHSFN